MRVMVVFDYLRWSEQDAALVEIQRAFQRSLPGLSVAMRGCWGPFEDSEGLASHFDGGANRLAGTKRVKRLRVDLLTSCAKVLREATGFKPQFLVGLGQGGLVAAVLRWRSSLGRPASCRRPETRLSLLCSGASGGSFVKGGAHLTLSRGTSTDQLKYITAWVVREGVVVLGHNSSPVDTVKSGVVLSWSVEPNWHGHRHLVNAVCESLWRASGREVALDPAFDRLLCLIGKPRRVEGWFDSEAEACIAHRRGLRKQGVLATFTCQGEGHWTTSPLSAKIVVDESKKARTLCFVGDLHREQCVVLELLTQHLVLTRWDHLASKVRVKVDPKSFAYPMYGGQRGRSSSRAAGDPG